MLSRTTPLAWIFRRACGALMLMSMLSARSAATGLGPDKLAEAIDRSHQQFLRIPGGVRVGYKLNVFQDRATGHFHWEDGAEGTVIAKWPRIYTKLAGWNHEDHQPREREGEYNFESGLGAGRDWRFVQITPYRQGWSCSILFPLRFLFFAEADQDYVLGEPHRSDYWLPSALSQSEYAFAGREAIKGQVCDVYKRRDGKDVFWIAPALGHAVCRRELRDAKTDKVVEITENGAWRRIHGDCWFPYLQVQEKYNYDNKITKNTGRPSLVLRVLVQSVKAGSVADKELHITIPDRAQVENQIVGVDYRTTGLGERGLEGAIKQARFDLTQGQPLRKWRLTTVMLGCTFAVLTIILGILLFTRVRSAGSARGRIGGGPSGLA
ncbi:MAG: hypothetical protein ACLQVF_44705 [Isosphaeraceae bacterium]